jgi:GT2 family glycosyltransferase
MDLSVIIVNYNVKFFLEQCLHSVNKSFSGITGEVIVIDNNSVDGSCQMVMEKFPQTIIIANKKNLGFSKANNQGMAMAKGKYILILNPDTVVEENTFRKCLDFMETHPKAGCLGVKMIDGKGNFLPESKRSLPTPLVSFFKIFGFSSLFPKSKIFGRYHLGFLNNSQTHKVDILCGAFMFARKSVLDKTGYFDETFFMYGEDIDLSYRIILAGYENYYFPETTIIHYKGESTKKGSINYVMIFYKAMIIFARKHFSRRYAWFYSLLIHFAIYLRATVSIIRRLFLSMVIPLSDAGLIFAGFYFFQPFWEKYRFGSENYYPDEYQLVVVPGYIIIWLSFLYISGGYEKKTKPFDILRGISLGSVFLLLIYALLPEQLRYSRALMLFGTVWTFCVVFFTRVTIGFVFKNVRILIGKQKRRIVILGSVGESDRVMKILKEVGIEPTLVGLVNWDGTEKQGGFMGDLSQLDEIIKVNKIDEIVFCGKDIPSYTIIQTMLSVSDSSVEFKIAPPESLSIIGSNSINTAGELYVVHFNSLRQNTAKRKKRVFDILVSVLFLFSIPATLFIVKNPVKFLRNIFMVLVGFRTWVSFYKSTDNDTSNLPHLPKGILTPVPVFEERKVQKETIERLNLLYAKDYKLLNDLSILFRDFRYLGK